MAQEEVLYYNEGAISGDGSAFLPYGTPAQVIAAIANTMITHIYVSGYFSLPTDGLNGTPIDYKGLTFEGVGRLNINNDYNSSSAQDDIATHHSVVDFNTESTFGCTFKNLTVYATSRDTGNYLSQGCTFENCYVHTTAQTGFYHYKPYFKNCELKSLSMEHGFAVDCTADQEGASLLINGPFGSDTKDTNLLGMMGVFNIESNGGLTNIELRGGAVVANEVYGFIDVYGQGTVTGAPRNDYTIKPAVEEPPVEEVAADNAIYYYEGGASGGDGTAVKPFTDEAEVITYVDGLEDDERQSLVVYIHGEFSWSEDASNAFNDLRVTGIAPYLYSTINVEGVGGDEFYLNSCTFENINFTNTNGSGSTVTFDSASLKNCQIKNRGSNPIAVNYCNLEKCALSSGLLLEDTNLIDCSTLFDATIPLGIYDAVTVKNFLGNLEITALETGTVYTTNLHLTGGTVTLGLGCTDGIINLYGSAHTVTNNSISLSFTLNDYLLSSSGGGGDDAATIYTYFTTGSNEDAFKATGFATAADVTSAQNAIISQGNSAWIPATGFATAADVTTAQNAIISQGDSAWITATGFSTFDPAADTVARVTLVDTTTSNTDMVNVSGLATQASIDLVDSSVDSIKATTDQFSFTVAGQVDANALTGGGGGGAPSVEEIADSLLARNIAGGSYGGRTVKDAFRRLRNKVTATDALVRVYAEDDSTTAWTADLVRGNKLPVQEVDPT